MLIMDMPPELPSEVPVLIVQLGSEKRWDVVMQDLTPYVAYVVCCVNLVNGTAARDALFGGGTAADDGLTNGLISKVIIGDDAKNDYPNMHEVLDKLGIDSITFDGHQNHFHIYLRPPQAVPIVTTQNLLADNVVSGEVALSESNVLAAAQALLARAKMEMNLIEGEIIMAIPDVPNLPPLYTPVMIAQAAQAQQVAANVDRNIGICRMISNPKTTSRTNQNLISPVAITRGYFNSFEHQALAGVSNVTVLQQPAHGTLEDLGTFVRDGFNGPLRDSGERNYYYRAEAGHVGQDSVAFLVEMGGHKVKVTYFLHVFDYAIEDNDSLTKELCPNGENMWKISTAPLDGIASLDNYLQSWLSTTDFSSIFFGASGVNLHIADLPGGAVGQTTGSTITLDSNAAGYNWFIDTTPADNSEYLPTSNPNEWVAKEGTDAYGKMNMLSVLLHEYGHALGIEHSADNHDYMATTLTPGVRRMPSAEEMALMQRLVAQAKGDTPLPNPLPQGERGLPDAPIPFPTLPLGASFGLAFIGRLRNSRYGGMSIAPDYATLTTQYAVAANAAFANLDTTAGWNTQGCVDFAPSTGSGRTDGGSVTLNEVSTSQTRLSQVFMLNEQDRYLSFTLAGSALDNLTGAPDDAFEVALLDANTGLSILGTDGLTRTDAFLNLQADGTQHTADCVTCINNADGSRTYRVDLTGVAKNTAVNLSFDLLGFGASNSHVTLRDIRVSGLPQLRDEVASIAEDNLLTFNPFTQADSQLIPSLASHIVDAPVHGALAMNADGTFSYTPDLNYFGADSFSYRLSDGSLDSNLATVSLTVTPVNDAPVVADVQATTAEDTELVIALGAYASDVDSTSLITQIVAGPAHGVLVANVDGSYTYTPEANYNGTDSFTLRIQLVDATH